MIGFAHESVSPKIRWRNRGRTAPASCESLCIACGLCREARPEGAEHPKMQDIHHMYEVLEAECTRCGDCLPYCPVPGALSQYELNSLV
jgi:NAD-dependent dihydropyrimidine dehydrogenase PreA subunit